MDFNDTKDRYVTTINQTIQFAGQEQEFYTNVKADYLGKIVEKHFGGKKPLSLLDIGCGHGLAHAKFREAGLDVVGVEVADEVLVLAKELNPDVTYLPYDGRKLPFPDKSFDVAIAICVMHHVPPEQWRDFLVEMRRVLRPGGLAAIFEHNPLNPLTQYVVANNDIDDDAVLLRAGFLRKLMADSGFKETHTRGILFTPFDTPVFRRFDEMMGWCPLGAQYYALGTAP